jgi:undecaprenyl-diphosphatase
VSVLDAILLGLVEGLTELLPVSSTGHLILLGRLLGHEGEGAKALDIVIQLGAVLAVAVCFRARLGREIGGLWRREPASIRLCVALGCAFLPAAVAGLALHRLVKQHLFGPRPVAAALLVGGVAMIAVEQWRARTARPGRDGLEHVGVREGLLIGLCQCLSLWPGASRSMTTIVGGQLCALSTRTAAEFSFLLALPTLGAATLYDLYENGAVILAMPSGAMALVVGTAVSFLCAWAVTALFLRYVSRFGLTPFGAYRIALAIAVWMWAKPAMP